MDSVGDIGNFPDTEEKTEDGIEGTKAVIGLEAWRDSLERVHTRNKVESLSDRARGRTLRVIRYTLQGILYDTYTSWTPFSLFSTIRRNWPNSHSNAFVENRSRR